LVFHAKQIGLLVNRVEHADVSRHDFGHNGCKLGVKVLDGPNLQQGKPMDGRVVRTRRYLLRRRQVGGAVCPRRRIGLPNRL